jgi:Tol biopolymer transport system component
MRRTLLLSALLLLASTSSAQDAVIQLGDSFNGAIDSPFDTDTVQFSSVAGALLTATVKASKGLVPALALHDQTSGEDLVLLDHLKGAGTKLTLKALVLPSTGDYVLSISPAQEQTGSYKLTTKVKLGKTVKSFKVDGATSPGGGAVVFGALPGVTLSALVKPDKGATAVPGVPLLDGPLGPIDLGVFTELKSGKKPSAKVSGVSLNTLGAYTFTPTELAADEPLPLTTALKLKFPKVVKTQHSEALSFANEQTAPVSLNTAGQQAAAGSLQAAASFNGHRIAFLSNAKNLVAGCGSDNATNFDVFLRDLDAGTTTSLSAPSGSSDGTGGCLNVAIDSAGDAVAFGSSASGLVPGDTGGFDIFVRDVATQQTSRVSVITGGAEAHPASQPELSTDLGIGLSGDGKLVAFSSDSNNLVAGDSNGLSDVFVHDRNTVTTTRASTSASGDQANGPCDQPDLSLDGTHLAFRTDADTLLPGDGNNNLDIYVKVLATGVVLRASLTATGGEVDADASSPSISGDGRFVAFESVGPFAPVASNGKSAVFVKDLQTGAVEAVCVTPSGSIGNASSSQPRLSASGQLVLFRSIANNLVSPDANNSIGDIYLRDRPAGVTVRVNLDVLGNQANGECFLGDLSSDGSHAVFLASSTTTNLWLGFTPSGNDQNNAADFFVRF